MLILIYFKYLGYGVKVRICNSLKSIILRGTYSLLNIHTASLIIYYYKETDLKGRIKCASTPNTSCLAVTCTAEDQTHFPSPYLITVN